jgi:hypothetical protein
MSRLEPLEIAVLQELLAGEHPVLVALRAQMRGLRVKTREFSGTGFFTELAPTSRAIPAPVPSGKLRFGDVHATIGGLTHGAGFLLYVDAGLLHMLEGYSYEEKWPEELDVFSVTYADPDRSDVLSRLGAATTTDRLPTER